MKYINTNIPVRLRTLIASGDLQDYSMVSVYDRNDFLLNREVWFHDAILMWRDELGIATQQSPKAIIKFTLVNR